MGNILGSGVRTEKFTLGDRMAGVQEAWEFRKVIREEHNVEKARRRIEADNRKHDLTQFRKDADKQVQEAAATVIDSHHLVMHDLKFVDYMMSTLVDCWLFWMRLQGKDRDIERKRIQQQILDILKEVQSDMQTEQQQVYAIEAASRGDAGVALVVKQQTRKGSYIIRRIVGRIRARREGKDLAKLHHERDMTAAAVKKKNKEDATSHIKKAISFSKDLLKLAYQILVTDYIVLKGMIDLLNGETDNEKVWADSHQIPESFLILDKEQRRKVMVKVEEELEVERKFGLNYLYSRVDKEKERLQKAA